MLESSRFDSENKRTFFFLRPVRIISIDELEDLLGLFSEIEESIGNGFFVAGYFAYECGHHFENITPRVSFHRSVPQRPYSFAIPHPPTAKS